MPRPNPSSQPHDDKLPPHVAASIIFAASAGLWVVIGWVL